MEISVKGAVKTEPVTKVAPGPLSLKLLRHWTPAQEMDVTILGYKRPAIVVRRSEGGTYIAEPEKFIEGKMAPPPVPGALNASWSPDENGKRVDYVKIWAGTYIEVEADIAYDLIDKDAAQLVRPG